MSTSGPPTMPDQEVPYGPYDQFILFGDSITQMSNSQMNGFAFASALQDGRLFITPLQRCLRLLSLINYQTMSDN